MTTAILPLLQLLLLYKFTPFGGTSHFTQQARGNDYYFFPEGIHTV